MSKWTPADIPDLQGQKVVVTGANTGIGFPTALELARAGADVVLACRDPQRASAAVARIGEHEISGSARAAPLNLASLASVRAFTEHVDDVDILINNAGVMMPPASKTEDGFELQWGTNVVGHFALTAALMPRIRDGGRVVHVSSIAHRSGRIDLDNMQLESPYKPFREYGQSKLGNLMFSIEMNRRLRAAGRDMTSIAAHPGISATELFRASKWGRALVNPFLQPAHMGALPTLHAAVANVPGGAYIGPSGIRELRGYPAAAEVRGHARDPKMATQLWQRLEEQSATNDWI
jgi:NAD(P)-dependent dehydrogenase (short-subunit alcohol dehydrogenase family)